MCGIFGVLYADSKSGVDQSKLWQSITAINHRGPDGSFTYVGPGIGLAHARLSLVDLDARSNQPFSDPSGRFVLVYNGEIYNFRELRSELEKLGTIFRTESDTEVLYYAMITWSAADILPRLNGMFAFALYDRVEGTVLLARDRFGTKPLYIYNDNAFLMFSSEIKAFTPWVEFEPNIQSISSYLLGFPGPTKGTTFFRNVKSLEPGSFCRIDAFGNAQSQTFGRISTFWDPAMAEELGALKPNQAVDRVEGLMWDAVSRQMFADAPVGAFCSGGVDSSLLVAMAAKQHNNLSIFHANMIGPWSEYPAALKLSKHLKLDMNVVEVSQQDVLESIPLVMKHYEHPFTYQPNSGPFMSVSHLVQQAGVKGVLTGEGSDELFLGYPWFGRDKMLGRYYAIVGRLANLVRSIPGVGPFIWPEAHNSDESIRDLFNEREILDERNDIRIRGKQIFGEDADESIFWTMEHLHYHLRTLLHRNDTMGMASGIEARFPFLDHDVVRFGVNLPLSLKLRFAPDVIEKAHPMIRDKWIIRKVADRWIPKELSQRIKIGFWNTVFQRAEISPKYFDNSIIPDILEISKSKIISTIYDADQSLKMKFLHLNIWADLFIGHRGTDYCVDALRDHVSIAPESRKAIA